MMVVDVYILFLKEAADVASKAKDTVASAASKVVGGTKRQETTYGPHALLTENCGCEHRMDLELSL